MCVCVCVCVSTGTNRSPERDIKPWRWVGHVLGHEGRGSLAASLKEQGLVDSLDVGVGDEVNTHTHTHTHTHMLRLHGASHMGLGMARCMHARRSETG